MMYPKTAAQSRSEFFRVKPGSCGALKLMSRVLVYDVANQR